MTGATFFNATEARSKKSNLGLAISESKKNIIDINDADIDSKWVLINSTFQCVIAEGGGSNIWLERYGTLFKSYRFEATLSL